MRTQNLHRIASSALTAIATLAVSLPANAQGNNMHSHGSSVVTHGVPASVTSFGFGGQRGFHGVPSSVTSPNFGSVPFQFHRPLQPRPIFAPHRHRDRRFGQPFYGSVIAVPYAYPVYADDPGADDSMEEQDYRGGPTVFDRKGSGTEEYVRPERREKEGDERDYRVASPAESGGQAEVAGQPRTILVFKDGRQLEILNYAIVGSTLFNLSDGLTRKVALADLDLAATVKQNDNRGVVFQLPGAKPN